MPEPASHLDPLIHPLPRLSICALLAAGPRWIDFRTVRESTGLSDSMISKHTRTLQEAGYLEVRKGGAGRRPRTWFRLTSLGRKQYQAHVDELQRLVNPTAADGEGSP